MFRTELGKTIFDNKYKHKNADTWEELAETLVEDVCDDLLTKDEKDGLKDMISNMKFIPGGRYLYYAGRPNKFYNNCYLLRSLTDTREDWASLSWKAESCLMTGGGIGSDYSIYRPKGSYIRKTGGYASGSVSKMNMINEIGRRVMQGGSRRSAIYASLNWRHGDVEEFLHAKDWYSMSIAGAYDKDGNQLTIGKAKEFDFNYPGPLDMTNISLNYDNSFLEHVYKLPISDIKQSLQSKEELEIKHIPEAFLENVKQALRTGEPGFSFNFFDKEKETLRNACTEVVSEDDSDVCNLGSLNLSKIETKEDLEHCTDLAIKFLLCGTLKADLPYHKIREIREKNRRLGLGLMGVHEWLLKRGYKYEVTPELHEWLKIYRDVSDKSSKETANKLSISKPVANRAIAPTGTIGIIAGTTTGIEPLLAVAYKRRYLKGENQWHYQYVIDGTAKFLIKEFGVTPDSIESAIDLEKDFERRIRFQADVQDYVDMAISSTINLSEYNSEFNNESITNSFAETLIKYAHRLRGFTCYPDGSRGGQPLTSVPYEEAASQEGVEFKEHDICSISSRGGFCGS